MCKRFCENQGIWGVSLKTINDRSSLNLTFILYNSWYELFVKHAPKNSIFYTNHRSFQSQKTNLLLDSVKVKVSIASKSIILENVNFEFALFQNFKTSWESFRGFKPCSRFWTVRHTLNFIEWNAQRWWQEYKKQVGFAT